MKIIAAAIALIATPALAQSAGEQTPPPAGAPIGSAPASGPVGTSQQGSDQPRTGQASSGEPVEPTTLSTATTPSQGPRARRAETDPGNNAAARLGGGLQPSQPALSGTPQPGVTAQFIPAPPPSQAFPAPAPLARYPLCRKGQYDKCREPGSAPTSERRRRRG